MTGKARSYREERIVSNYRLWIGCQSNGKGWIIIVRSTFERMSVPLNVIEREGRDFVKRLPTHPVQEKESDINSIRKNTIDATFVVSFPRLKQIRAPFLSTSCRARHVSASTPDSAFGILNVFGVGYESNTVWPLAPISFHLP